jgi:arylformamidase
MAGMTDYRASFDAEIRFSNGGDLTAHGFRVDLPSADADEAEIAALFVASLGLLMTDAVRLSNVRIFAEPHKGTRGGPADRGADASRPGGRLVELSHVIRADMLTYPGLPIGNTGTYLDAPYHRYADGADLSAIPLDQPSTGRPWSASTRSTSTTPRTGSGRRTRCCWRRASRSWST